MDKILIVENLKKSYGKIEAVKKVSFKVEKNEIFALIGPNGAGKSTVLKIIATLLSVGDGNVTIFDKNLAHEPNEIRKMISYLPEEAGAYKNMTGYSYLKFMANIFLGNQPKIDEAIKIGTDIADLGNRITDKIGTYSKGMTRKLLIARTMMVQPKLAILDEPTSGLDVINAMSIRNQIKKQAQKGMSVLLSSHNMLEIEYLSDRVAIISDGVIHDSGKPSELKKKYNANNLEEVFIKLVK
jgi:ABC-2 type transport system ATP-binding protein